MLRLLLGPLVAVAAAASVAGDWVGFGASPGGCNGSVNAGAVLPDGRFVIGGDFTMCGDAIATRIAIYDPQRDRWSALPGGGVRGSVPVQVHDMVLMGETLYVAGNFDSAGGVGAIDLAAYDLRTQRWQSMGVPGSDQIYALAASGSDLYVGGSAFGAPGLSTAVNIARYRVTENRWETLGTGFTGAVFDLAAAPGVVYANGVNRSTTGPGDEFRLSRYRLAEGAWTTLQTGARHTFLTRGSRLYASRGTETAVSGAPRLVAFDLVSDAMEVIPRWPSEDPRRQMTLLKATEDGLLGFVGALDLQFVSNELLPSELLRFDFADRQWRRADTQLAATDQVVRVYLQSEIGTLVGGGLSTTSVKILKSGTWQPTPDGAPLGIRSTTSMAASGSDFWLAGSFAQNESMTRIGVMRRRADSAQWQWFGHPQSQNPAPIQRLLSTSAGVFAAAQFRRFDQGQFSPQVLARLDPMTAQWELLQAPFDEVPSVLMQDGDFMYVTGRFGKIFRYHLPSGQWNEIAQFWSGIPFPRGTLPSIAAMAIDGGRLYLAGTFREFNNDSAAVSNLGFLDLAEGRWRALDGAGEQPSFVRALVVHNGMLYAGHGSGVSRYHLAERRWESFLQADGAVLRLRIIGGSLGAVGNFTTLAGRRVNGVALVDPRDGRVSAIGPADDPGVVGEADNMVQAGSRLYVTGDPSVGRTLSGAGGVASRNLIAWDLDRVRVTELYNRRFNHYFITAEPAEVEQLLGDPVLSQELSTTGARFSAWRAGFPGAAGVCRFRGSSIALNTNSSHFYTRQPAECAGLTAGTPPGWIYERDAFAVAVPTSGECASGTQPVYRSYNRRIAAESHNHRYTTSAEVHQQMLSRGHADEGVAFCVPLPVEPLIAP